MSRVISVINITMYFFLNLLLFVTVYCKSTTIYDFKERSPTIFKGKGLNFNDTCFKTENRGIFKERFKREIKIEKNDDETYSINAKKDIKFDDDKSVEANGRINGLKPAGGFKDINAGVGYKDQRGNILDLFAQHSNNGDTKLSAQGKLNILNSPERNLDAAGFIIKDYINRDVHTKYGGSLDLSTRLGNNLGLFAEHSNDGDTKLSAKGNFNIFDTPEKKLDATGFIEKNFLNSDAHTKYGGGLDLSTRDGSGASVSVLHDSKVGDLLNADGKLNIFKDNGKSLDIQGSWAKTSPLAGLGPVSELYRGSINYANRNGNSASVAAAHVPEFGDQLSATGKFNLFHNKDHNLDASGTFTRNLPINKEIGNFNKYTGKLDYNYKDKLGLGLGVDHTDFGRRTDLSALANLNLFHDKDTSFDFNAGVQKTLTPTYSSPFNPFFGLTLKTSFK